MSLTTSLWKVGKKPKPLNESTLISEQLLEDMIVESPSMLSEDWLLVGRQVRTAHNTPLDLLAMAPDGSLVLIELKRDKTPREVVAQAIDYATWVETLSPDEIQKIYTEFTNGSNLSSDFETKFGALLDEDDVNQSHQIIIVAAQLDASSERIINYLNERTISINVLFFQVFELDGEQIISRTWMVDPVETQSISSNKSIRAAVPWNGEFYCSFGHGEKRNWNEAIKYNFVCAGGGEWYSRTLTQLQPGDKIWVKAPGYGFVGYGEVSGIAIPMKEFKIKINDEIQFANDILNEATYHREHINDLKKCEYFVPVNWLKTIPLSKAIHELGMFGNQNTVCKPTTPQWPDTTNRLKALL